MLKNHDIESWLAITNCMCDLIPNKQKIEFVHNLIILQHHKEWLKGTNTGIDVLNNCSNSRLLVVGVDEIEREIKFLKNEKKSFVLFCSPTSIPLSKAFPKNNFNENESFNFIIPDATWKNSRKLFNT
eukprot:TRINITY_DN3653_c0_g1_i1.p1 TRINITY_DN3653_c0_g1~~TRINITY_DN3653_c0_g1_i1.p1  ORF type:complete len:128 (-),score=35.29 TRINITY_DN3653_c0_g1_i1:233-616(-)